MYLSVRFRPDSVSTRTWSPLRVRTLPQWSRLSRDARSTVSDIENDTLASRYCQLLGLVQIWMRSPVSRVGAASFFVSRMVATAAVATPAGMSSHRR